MVSATTLRAAACPAVDPGSAWGASGRVGRLMAVKLTASRLAPDLFVRKS